VIAAGKPSILAGSFEETRLGELLAAIAPHGAMPLVFEYEGRVVRPGYHVTEVKAGTFAALDCGAGSEEWAETFVQLWDVGDGDGSRLSAGKFHAIIREVAERVGLDMEARLTFEVSDGVRAIQLYRASRPVVSGGAVRVALEPRPASCKPRDRCLDESRPPETACCEPQAKVPCCA
jgi:hypothetical protein